MADEKIAPEVRPVARNRRRTSKKFSDLTGQTFERLTVVKRGDDYIRSSGKPVIRWECICQCGKNVLVESYHLKRGYTKSCGCFRRDINSTHRGTGTTEHNIWATMKARVLNPNHIGYERYGGRGITICDEWMVFENFLRDMGHRPPGMTLERINNDGPYSASNCKWATPTEQARNRTNNTFLEVDGVSRTIAEWGEVSGIRSSVICNRLFMGWNPKRCVTEPVNRHTRKNK